MQIAQLIAAHAVADVLQGHNLTVSLPKAQQRVRQATPQQRAAAQDLSYLTLRFYAEAEALLAALTPKPVTDWRVRGLLLVAIAQLCHDEATAFTVVNQAVEAAGRLKLSWAKGLVNGVLRNAERQRSRLMPKLQQRESVLFNYPQWWITHLKNQYPQHWQAILHAGNAHPPLTLRVNLARGSVSDYLSALQQAGYTAQAVGPTAVMLDKPVPVQLLPGFEQGWVSVQDAAAQWAAPLLDIQSGMRVLDACSAPGGKTAHVLEWCQQHARKDVTVTALDVDAVRLQRVHQNLQRCGLSAKLITGDAASRDWFDGNLFDRILADVPCSASGIVRRHVDMKWLRRADDVELFAQQQSRLLGNLWQMLAKGGKLLYVTCSVFQEENEMQIRQFLQAHHDAGRLPVSWAECQFTLADLASGQLLPSRFHDGLYYALLQKHD